MDLFLKLSVLQANFCWLGEVEEIICRLKENVAGKKIIEGGVSEGTCIRNLAPLPHWRPEVSNLVLRPHPNWPVMSGHTSVGKLPSKLGCRCTLLAENTSISLAGSEEQIKFSQQSPKMLKMASASFIHALLLGLFLKNFRWVLL